MKYWKWIAAAAFIVLLILMRRYSGLLADYGMTQSLDMSFGYTAGEVYSTLKKLGSDGLKLLTQYYIIDFIFIAVFAAAALILQHLILGERLLATKLRLLDLAIYVRGVFDLAENAMFVYLIKSLPAEHPGLVPVMSLCTQIKLVFVGLWLAALAVTVIARIVTVRRGETGKKTNRKNLEEKK